MHASSKGCDGHQDPSVTAHPVLVVSLLGPLHYPNSKHAMMRADWKKAVRTADL
jgi:hypothetical protein